MRRLLHGWTLRIAVPVGVTLALAAAGLAYFTSHGSGSATAGVGTLAAPAITSANPGAGTVALSWSTVTPQSGTVTYYVTRDGGTPGGTCPTSAAPTTATSCTDSGLPAGSHSYTVTAKWHSWTATSSTQSVTLASGAATHFTLSAATTSPTAGVGDNLTVTLKDSSDLTVSTYTGPHNLTFGGASTIGTFNPSVTDKDGIPVNFGTSTTIMFVNGVATASSGANGVMTLYKVESANITVTDGSTSSSPSLSIAVSAAAASRLAFLQQPTNSTGGIAFPQQAKIAIQDTFGNTVTTDSSTVTLSITSGTPATGGPGTLSGCSQSETLGVVTFSGCKIDTAGTGYRLHAVDVSLTAADSGTFDITVGPAAQLAFTQQPSGSTGGVALGTQPQVAIKDAGGNTVTGNTSSVTLALTAPTGAVLSCTANPLAAVSGLASFAGCKIDVAGSYTLTATDGALASAVSNSITITVGPAAKLGFTQQPSGATTNVAFGTQPKVAIQDAGGNTVTGNTSSVMLALTTPAGATLSCTPNPLAAASGVATFAGCRIDLAGSYTLTATDGALTSAVSNSMTITAAGSLTARATGAWNVASTWSALKTGTITTTTSSTTVSGSGTSFTTQVLVGDTIFQNNGTTVIGTVTSIVSNTSLTLSVNAAVAVAGATYFAGRVPTASDDVSIRVADTIAVTIPTGYAAAAATLTISDAAAHKDDDLIVVGTGSLAVGGDVNFNRPIAGATNNLNIGTGTVTVGGDLNFIGVATNTNRFALITITSGTLTIAGDLVFTAPAAATAPSNQIDMSGGAGVLNLGGTFTVAASAGGSILPGTTSVFNFNGTGPSTVPGYNYANLTISGVRTSNSVTFDSAGTIGVAAAFSPTATFSSGGFVVTGNTVNFNGTGAQTVPAFNFNSLTISGARAANSVTLASSGTIGVAGTFGATATFAGGAYVVGGSTIDFNGSAGQTIPAFNYNNLTSSSSGARTLAGTVGVAGTLTPGTNGYTITGSTVNFNGIGAQTVPAFNYNNLTISGARSTNIVTLASSGTIGVAAALSATATSVTYATTGSTINFNGAGQTVPAASFSYNNLTISGTNTKTAGAGLTVNGDLTITAGTFAASTFSHSIGGNFTNNGIFTTGAGSTVTFNSLSAQTISGSTATTFVNLTISNASGVSLNGVDATATGTLALGSSVLTTGSRKMIVTATTPTRTSGYVDGALQRTGAAGTLTFAVGNGSNYTPVDLTLVATSTGTITVRSTAGEHANVATSGISSTKDVNTYWALSTTGTITFPSSPTVAATFNYPSTNVDGLATPSSFLVKRWVSPNWSAVTVSGTPSNTSTSITGLTSAALGDFVIGNP